VTHRNRVQPDDPRYEVGQLHLADEELARERDRLKRLNYNLVRLHQLGQALSGVHEANEIVRLVAEGVRTIVPYDVFTMKWREEPALRVCLSGTMNSAEARSSRHEGLRRRRTSVADDFIAAVEVPLLSKKETIGAFRVERRQGLPFAQADRELMRMAGTSLALALTNAEAHHALEQMAMQDGLTGLYNRRAFDQFLGQEIKAAERYRSPVCLLLADVDHFKAVNDRFGHPAGDTLLKEVAALLRDSLREVDRVARYGGEEFAVILPRTGVASGRVLANRIRERIARHAFLIQRTPIRLTLSLGVAEFAPASMSTPDDFVTAADRALYQAKARGRNRVEIQAERALSPAAEPACLTHHPRSARLYA
jgi:diguanylate cyclase (GGDEF)-like protein